MKVIICAISCSAALVCGATLAVAQEMTPAALENGSSSTANGEQAQEMGDIVVTGQTLAQPKSEQSRNWLDKYLPYEQRVAGWVDNTARGIDRFFGTDDAWRIDNDSYLRVTNDMSWELDEGVSQELRPRLRLDLPTATKRLHLLIESDAPEERATVQEAAPGLRSREERRRTTVFGLGTNFEGWLPQWKKQLQGGLRVALPLDPYVRFIARRDVPLGGAWELNSYNRLSWFNSDGYAAKSEIKIGEPLAPDWRLYYSTDLNWREKRDYLEFAQGANLANILSPRSAITYTLGFSGTGFEGPHIDKYFLTANYRRNVARRIVFFDVIPELSLPEKYGFDPHWAITLRLELYFQKKIEGGD